MNALGTVLAGVTVLCAGAAAGVRVDVPLEVPNAPELVADEESFERARRACDASVRQADHDLALARMRYVQQRHDAAHPERRAQWVAPLAEARSAYAHVVLRNVACEKWWQRGTPMPARMLVPLDLVFDADGLHDEAGDERVLQECNLAVARGYEYLRQLDPAETSPDDARRWIGQGLRAMGCPTSEDS